MRRKRCRCCRELYLPEPRSYRQQKTCRKMSCRRWRRQRAWRGWSMRHPIYWESRKIKQKKWRREHADYWASWRRRHPEYLRRNRLRQRVRNAKNRGLIAKSNDLNTLHIDKLRQILLLRWIAKPNDLEESVCQQIDGLCRYLLWCRRIAKPNDMDGKKAWMRK